MEPSDDYIAVAFADINGDFVYQPGEPAHLARDVKLTFAEDMGEGNYSLETLPAQHMSLDEDTDKQAHFYGGRHHFVGERRC